MRCLSVTIVRCLFLPHDPRVTDTDAFLRSWDDLLAHAFTSFALFREVLISLCSLYLFYDICGSLVAIERMVYGFSEPSVSSSSSTPCATLHAAAVGLPSSSFSPCASVFTCGDFSGVCARIRVSRTMDQQLSQYLSAVFQPVSASLALLL